MRLVAALGVVVFTIMLFAASEDQSQSVAVLVVVALAFAAVTIWWRLYQSKRRRLRAKTLGELLAMTPTQFEQAVADLLHDIGYRDVRRVARRRCSPVLPPTFAPNSQSIGQTFLN